MVCPGRPTARCRAYAYACCVQPNVTCCMPRAHHVQANVMALDESGGKRGDSKRAAFEAYAEHLEPFHNWLLKNTFQVRHSK